MLSVASPANIELKLWLLVVSLVPLTLPMPPVLLILFVAFRIVGRITSATSRTSTTNATSTTSAMKISSTASATSTNIACTATATSAGDIIRRIRTTVLVVLPVTIRVYSSIASVISAGRTNCCYGCRDWFSHRPFFYIIVIIFCNRFEYGWVYDH